MSGYKTYAAAALMVVYAVVGYVCNMHGLDTMTQLIMNALAVAGLRHGTAKETEKLLNRFQ